MMKVINAYFIIIYFNNNNDDTKFGNEQPSSIYLN